MKNLVLYHNNCTDGFMSAVLLYLYFKEINEEVEFIAVSYNQPIPDVTDKNVYIVDFSYSKEVIEKASLIATSITMLDHHLSAAQQWGGYGGYTFNPIDGCAVSIYLVEDKSGAGLAYSWIMSRFSTVHQTTSTIFHSDKNRRIYDITKAVQDRDLWQFKLEKTKEIYEALNIIPRTFEAWENFLITLTNDEYDEKIKAAGYYLEVKEKLAQEYASKFQMVHFLNHYVPIVNCPANFASRVGEILNKDQPFAITYCLSTTDIFVSFRSSEQTGIDVSEIAKQFHGGGHRNAAGCKISTDFVYYFLSEQMEYVRRQINPAYYNVI